MNGPPRDDTEAKELLVTIAEAARRLAIGRSHIYDQMQRGKLRSVRIGRSRRILERDLDAFIERLIDDPDGIAASSALRHRIHPIKSLPKRSGRR